MLAHAQRKMMTPLEQTDPQVFKIIADEKERQEHRLEMIASENFTSRAVMEAQGSILTNKYCGRISGQEILRRLQARRCD